MAEPTIVPRAEHTISRRDVDPDALKVLYRLHEHHYIAYLVGGSVRDLLLNRRPKDFDIGTSAHPHQVKKLFRNCWIIGRRFRLAHVKFGTKTIEVATFRRHVAASRADAGDRTAAAADAGRRESEATPDDRAAARRRAEDHLIHRDNTYGTPEEDAFRRDFTVNALFYDIGTFSIIDYVGGLDDLDARVIRCIGDPEVRFLEDPVRMLRAVVLAARLQFDDRSAGARRHRDPSSRDRAQRARRGCSRSTTRSFARATREEAFTQLRATGLLKAITPELPSAADRSGARLPRWIAIARGSTGRPSR